MITSNLQRVQIEFCAHRLWLESFVTKRALSRLRSPGKFLTLQPSSGLHRPQYRRSSQSAIHHDTSSKVRRVRGRHRHERDPSDYLAEKKALVAAISGADPENMIQAYSQLSPEQEILPREFYSLAQTLHQCLRVAASSDGDHRLVRRILAFTRLLVEHVQSGFLPPSPAANVHLLSMLNQADAGDDSLRFWEWLKVQPDPYVSHDVYAAAIELHAAQRTPLAEMELMYTEALERFPGSFLAYHLAPEAILPDREQKTTLKGVPVLLLQAIMTARILRGDTQGAYQALDVAFRLYPHQVPRRFFKVIMDERPISEAFMVLAMGWRSGNGSLSTLLKPLSTGILQGIRPYESPQMSIASIRLLIVALQLNEIAGGNFSTSNVNSTTIALTRIISLPGIHSLRGEERRKVVNAIMAILRIIFDKFAQHRAYPGAAAFTAITKNIAGAGRTREALDFVQTSMANLNLPPSEAMQRALLDASGLLGEPERVMETWSQMVASKNPLSSDDFRCLIRASSKAECPDFAHAQFGKHSSSIKNAFERAQLSSLLYMYDQTAMTNSQSSGSATHSETRKIGFDLDEIDHCFATLYADLETWQATTNQSDSKTSALSTLPTLQVPGKLSLSIGDDRMRGLYDKLTAPEEYEQDAFENSDSAEKVASQEPASVHAGRSFGELRYENWKTMNALLQLAEKHDEEYSDLVRAAAAADEMPPLRNRALSPADVELLSAYFLGARTSEHDVAHVTEGEVKAAWGEILRLRRRRPA